MNKTAILSLTALLAVSSYASGNLSSAFGRESVYVKAAGQSDELKVTADRLAADRVSGSLVASGNVNAVSHPYRLITDELSRDAERRYVLSEPTTLTTCTNEECCLHWRVTGNAEFVERRHVIFRNMWVRMFEVPVMWLPYWYYPLDTDYGWRVMPGYMSKWGAYLLTKYVYHIAGDPSGEEGAFALRGNTRFDLRAKNGVALGQSLGWRLGDFGTGKFKVYYAWDDDHSRYDRHWSDNRKWNYQNWGSTVPSERYALMLSHRWEATERDVVRGRAAYFSDSHFSSDFLRQSLLSKRNTFVAEKGNELAWEHNETLFGLGMSVTGPLSQFAGGVARLPEAYIDVLPQPVFSLPVNYESQTYVGYYDRRPKVNGRRSSANAYSYIPGQWAEYNTFRLDTYHRLTLPMKYADVLSVVPRVGVRGTYWGDSGYENISGETRAGSSGDDMSRFIAEGGITFATRGVAWINDRWQHMMEPYLDVLAQEAEYSGDGFGKGGKKRPYVFDYMDASIDWQDQFAGRSRNLPYSWYGVTPGFRNTLRRTDERGHMRTVFDVDGYASVQFNKTRYTDGDRYHRLARLGDPNYGRHAPYVVPGMRTRWFPSDDIALAVRAEYDTHRNKLAMADVEWRQVVNRRLQYFVDFLQRDYRRWDFSSSPYRAKSMRSDEFNMVHFSFADVGFEYELCEAIAIGPYMRWDLRDGKLDEIGSWFDYRTDCLGFRLQIAYEDEYTRIDGSEYDHDWRVGFYVYLRAFGPSWGNVMGD
jgi:hypothetical protein